MQGWISNTHQDWFDFLSSRRTSWEEVNFWTPSDYFGFNGIPGAPFFFRLKSPRNAIGGFGLFSRFARLPDWLAWECFGEGNGAPDFSSMHQRLNAIRRQNQLRGRTPGGEPQIGCIILSDAVFFPSALWVRQPADWGRQNLRYKGYDLTVGEGRRVWEECLERAVGLQPAVDATAFTGRSPVRRYGEPVLMRPRLGQGAFRVAVTDAYGRACSATGEHSLPALEAAHIRPYSMGGAHEIQNGLLLRSDLHRLFDRGYVTVTPELRLEVSRRLKEDYDNGRTYYPLHGHLVRVPRSRAEQPDPELLHWHNEHVFRT